MHVDLAIVFTHNTERNRHAQHSNVRRLVIDHKTRIVAGAWSGLFNLVGELIFILVSPVLFPDQTAHDQQGALEVEI